MDARDQPLVSILTPTYNNGLHIAECIASVLAQTYSNWEYTIVNNCSTDGTLEVAQKYAAIDKRIRVHNNTEFLAIIANHNAAFGLISAQAKYCKVVSGDDFIRPECVEKMVDLAEANPSVGIVGSYQLSGGGGRSYVRFTGLPYEAKVVPGREICRAQLLTPLSVFGAPTCLMYRADLVRESKEFFPNPTAEADVSACFAHLQSADFGFVHQILSNERLHEGTVTSISKEVNAYLPSSIGDLLTYGPIYLTQDELQRRLKELMKEYYAFLAVGVANFRERKFWDYHKRRLRELGYPLKTGKLTAAVTSKAIDLIFNPKTTLDRVANRIRAKRKV
jgi:glycosyltransferase involved in cell wall biosynthesis